MSVMQALFTFKGRMTRRDYWLKGVIFLSPLSVLISTLFLLDSTVTRVLSVVLSVLVLWPGIALTVKRLHDYGNSGWFAATLLIPAADLVFAVIIFIRVGFLRGTVGANRFGADPLPGGPIHAVAEPAVSIALFRPAGLSPSIDILRIPTFFENASWRAVSISISFGFLILGLVMLLNFAPVVTPHFFDLRNMSTILSDFLLLGLMAMPMAAILSNGGVDLSIGAVVGLSAMVMASTLRSGAGVPAAVLLTLCIALLVGLLNGVIVAVMRWPGFLITLAMLFLARSVSGVIAGGKTIPFQGEMSSMGGTIAGWALLVALGILLVAWIQYPGIGARENRRGEKAASRLAGAGVIGAPYLLSSLVAGFAGIMLFTRIRAGTPSLGTNYEVFVLLAVVLAGLYPGAKHGNAFGVLCGAFFVAILRNLFALGGTDYFVQQVVIGALFVLALVFNFALNAIIGIAYRGRHQVGQEAPK